MGNHRPLHLHSPLDQEHRLFFIIHCILIILDYRGTENSSRLGLSSLTSRYSQRGHRKANLATISLIDKSQVVSKRTEVRTLQLRVFKTFNCPVPVARVTVPTDSAFGLQDISGCLESPAEEEEDTILGAVVVASHVPRFIDEQNWIVSDLELVQVIQVFQVVFGQFDSILVAVVDVDRITRLFIGRRQKVSSCLITVDQHRALATHDHCCHSTFIEIGYSCG